MTLDRLVAAFDNALFDTDRDRALRVVREAVADGITPEAVIFDVVIPALEEHASALQRSPEACLAQHFLTSQIAAEVTDEMLPLFKRLPETVGRIVIGNAQGDLHTLGKRIVMGCLRARMIECHDLGINVAPERFVEEAVARKASVIAISAMMVHTARGENGCLKVRQILRERALENQVRIIVGGAPFRFDPRLYQLVKADAWAVDGIAAVRVITRLIEEVRL